MVLSLITNTVLDVTWGVAYWTLKKTGSGIYNLGRYMMGYDNEPEDEEKVILMEEIGKLRDEIRELKETIG